MRSHGLTLSGLFFSAFVTTTLSAPPTKPQNTTKPPQNTGKPPQNTNKPPQNMNKPPAPQPKPSDDGRTLRRETFKKMEGGKWLEVTRTFIRTYSFEGGKWVAKEKHYDLVKPTSGGNIGPSNSSNGPVVLNTGGGIPGGGFPGGAVQNSGTLFRPDTTTTVGADVPRKTYGTSFLRVVNNTGEKIRVHVQLRALNERNEWVWVPADPAESDQGIRYTFDEGENALLEDEGGKIRASRVRIWGESDSGKSWTKYKETDLWIVPTDGEGKRRYLADEMKTHVFTFGAAK